MTRPWGDVLEVKSNIADVLGKELRRRRDGVVGVGTVTDPYQPVEERLKLTRNCLALLRAEGMEVSILTKSPLVLRDLDILQDWPKAEVGLSVATMDERLSSVLEPGAPRPSDRMDALETLNDSGVRTYLMAAPILPGLSDDRALLSELISRASSAGVRRVMWDMYNPKPLAHRRLRYALGSAGLLGMLVESPSYGRTVHQFLESECKAHAIELVYAF